MTEERDLLELLQAKPALAWHSFVDRHTSTILATLERAGITDHDEAMEVYVEVCRSLSDNGCARLSQYDPSKGSFESWLRRVVRNAVVDWIRARAGRRRLFKNVEGLSRLHQRCFELFFWDGRTPAEITEELSVQLEARVSLVEVLDAIDRIQETLTERQRSELVRLAGRGAKPLSLAGEHNDATELDPPDARPDAEAAALGRETRELFESALSKLSHQEAAIVRLKYVQGLSLQQIGRALHLPELTYRTIRAIEDKLKTALTASLDAAALSQTSFLERGSDEPFDHR